MLDDGEVEAADVVVVGIGVTPRVELAGAAGLDVDNGIVVDEHLQTSAPGVYAAGDVATAWHPHYRPPPAGRALGQRPQPGHHRRRQRRRRHRGLHRLPYFFSDQYDLGMEYVGHSRPGDASWSAATSTTASSSPSGTATASSPPP